MSRTCALVASGSKAEYSNVSPRGVVSKYKGVDCTAWAALAVRNRFLVSRLARVGAVDQFGRYRQVGFRTDCGDFCGYTPSKKREIVGSTHSLRKFDGVCKALIMGDIEQL